MISIVFGLIMAVVVYLLGGFRIFPALVAGVLGSLLDYSYLPVIRLDFVAPWMCAFVSIGVGLVLSLLLRTSKEDNRAAAGLGILFVGFVGLLVVIFVTSSTIFHAQSYADLLGKVERVPFEQVMQRLDLSGHPVAADATVIDQTDVRLVDAVLAERRAQEILGQDPEYGGTYQLDTMQLTRRNGKLTWAAPLQFSGLMRWLSGGDGTPAYVWVDAHDPKEAGLVKQIDGKPIHMRCIDTAWMGDNIERSVRAQGFQSTGLMEYSFELDDKGRPQYVVTAYAHRVGFDGDDVTGVVVFDPQACHAQYYALRDLPVWVNRAIPASMVFHQAQDWGEYQSGWWNATFGASTGVVAPTPGIELVSTSRGGDTAWYMGMATHGNPSGTTGFMLVDSRNKSVKFFNQAGATEGGARAAILGKIAEKRGWDATWPILYNISGRPTYLATLKDASGNFKGVGLMPVDDRNLVVVADDLRRGLLLYQQVLAGQNVPTGGATSASSSMVIDGVVSRINSEVIDGNTVYYMVIQGHEGTVLTATNRIGPQVALTSRGDKVSITASGDTGSGSLSVQGITNSALSKQDVPVSLPKQPASPAVPETATPK